MTQHTLPLPRSSSSTDGAQDAGGRALPAGRDGWRRRFARRLAWSDSAVVAWATLGALVWESSHAGVASHPLQAVVVGCGWAAMLAVSGARAPHLLGSGVDEYKRVLTASFRLFGLVAIVAFMLGTTTVRDYLVVSFPVGAVSLVFSRWLWRQWLSLERRHGRCLDRVLVVGHEPRVADFVRGIERHESSGLVVVGACLSAPPASRIVAATGTPVLGDLARVSAAARTSQADIVAVTACDEMTPSALQRLSWSLEAEPTELVVVPSLTDVAAQRLHTRLVEGLPLLHVDQPRFRAGTRVTKRVLDVAGSLVALVLLLPVMLAVAAAVKLGDRGPVLYRQERVGYDGRPFRMVKFRSMAVDAEARLAALAGRDDGNGVLFKMRHDPRVTRVGRVLRRYSLDELPQLCNVLRGHMSLVGPRPPLPQEVELYDDPAHRRLLVKPGITGLWQVSGRSDLSWEESVHLDLYYVENWSLATDLLILGKTFRAVVSSRGAY